MTIEPRPRPASPSARDTAVALREELIAFVARRVHDRPTAEDIVHDVLERLVRAAPGSITNPKAWLYRAARNAIIDHYRTRRHTTALPDLPAPDASSPEAAPGAATQELAACLRPLLGGLPDHYREAVERVDLDGYTHRQAAELAGISVPGMKSRVQRGRRRLGDLLTRCCHVITDTSGAISDYQPLGSCRCHPGSAATAGEPLRG